MQIPRKRDSVLVVDGRSGLAFNYIRNVKRAYAILMLAILLVNGTGFYAYYIIQLRQIRAEMRQALKLRPDHELDVIALTVATFKEALVEEDEMKVNGRMYDIARVEKSGNLIRVYCLHDEKEDDLIALLQELVSKPLKDRSDMPSEIINFITLNFVKPQADFVLQSFYVSVVNNSPYRLSSGVLSSAVVTPPPRFY